MDMYLREPLLAISAFLRRNGYAAMLAGWLFSRFVLSFLRMIEISGLVLLPGFLLALFCTFHLSRALFVPTSSAFVTHFTNGVLTDSFFFWVVRPGSGAAVEVSGPWDPKVFAGSAAAFATATVLLFLATIAGRRIKAAFRRPGRLHALLAAACPICIIPVFRVAGSLLRHLPNEERSLFIAGCEVHHAYEGVIAIMVLGILMRTRCVANRLPVVLACGVASAFILDQIPYVLLEDASDASYFGAASLTGAVVGAAAYAAYVVYLGRRYGEAGQARAPASGY